MKVNLVMDKTGCYNCFESPVVSVMKLVNRDYELMFSQSWGFSFDKPTSSSDFLIGQYLSAGNNTMLEDLKKLHGIEMKICDVKDTNEFIMGIKNEINRGLPAMFLTDVFWCPWYKGAYQVQHSPHYVTIIDVDGEGNLLCMDSQAAADEAFYMYNKDLINSYHQNYISFLFNGKENVEISLKELLTKSINKLKESNDYGNSFDQMRTLSKYINENGINFSKETNMSVDLILEKAKEKYSYGLSIEQMNRFSSYIKSTGLDLDPYESYIFDAMLELSNGRNKFKNYLRYLEKRYNARELREFEEKIKKTADRWNSIFGMLAKAYYIQDSSIIVKRVAAKINEAADDEEKIAEGIEAFINNKSISNNFIAIKEADNATEEKFISIDGNMKESYAINLNNYFNSKGFAELSNPGSAEISNGGRFLIADNLSEKQTWKVGNMTFEFPKIDVEYNDNISCNGQVIDINIPEYRYIMFLGCAEFGNHSEYITMEFKNGAIEKVPLELTSWLKAEPNFNETIAWVGRAAIKSGEKIDIYNYPAHLYAKGYPIINKDDIVKMILPICPNIHVFGIYLIK